MILPGSFGRRRLVRAAILGTLAMRAPALAVRAADETKEDPHWSYDGDEGPEFWGDLDPKFAACSLGMQQSPIAFNLSETSVTPDLKLPTGPANLASIENNGHTIVVTADPGVILTANGTEFQLREIHFHAPSEHRIDGVIYPMEYHQVFVSADGNIAAVGVLVKEGPVNETLAPIFDALPTKEGPALPLTASIDASGLYPEDRMTFTYIGSLTTPPCTEGLFWEVFTEPVTVSVEQMARYLAIFPFNARPIQATPMPGA
ncbi:MAG: carbonic anhydrase [Thermomicrobiales bacterium]